jgi:hypothetical protein
MSARTKAAGGEVALETDEVRLRSGDGHRRALQKGAKESKAKEWTTTDAVTRSR